MTLLDSCAGRPKSRHGRRQLPPEWMYILFAVSLRDVLQSRECLKNLLFCKDCPATPINVWQTCVSSAHGLPSCRTSSTVCFNAMAEVCRKLEVDMVR